MLRFTILTVGSLRHGQTILKLCIYDIGFLRGLNARPAFFALLYDTADPNFWRTHMTCDGLVSQSYLRQEFSTRVEVDATTAHCDAYIQTPWHVNNNMMYNIKKENA